MRATRQEARWQAQDEAASIKRQQAVEKRAQLPALDIAKETLARVTRSLIKDYAAPMTDDAVTAAVIVQGRDPDIFSGYLKNLKARNFVVGPLKLALAAKQRELARAFRRRRRR